MCLVKQQKDGILCSNFSVHGTQPGSNDVLQSGGVSEIGVTLVTSESKFDVAKLALVKEGVLLNHHHLARIIG